MKNTLKHLKKGQKAIVSSLDGYGVINHRLADMGITPGTAVTVINVAPLGDPIKIKLRGYELSLRLEDAMKIHVNNIMEVI